MKNIDVLIHINDEIDSQKRANLLDQLKNVRGVIDQKFSETKSHLLLVKYDAEITNSLNLLNQVKAHGFESQLVAL